MQTRTIIDRIEIDPQTGNVGVRMKKQIIDETLTDPDTGDKVVLAEFYHRTMIAPGTDPSAMMALVNTHLATMGYPAVKSEDVSVLTAVLAAPEISALRAAKAQEALARRSGPSN